MTAQLLGIVDTQPVTAEGARTCLRTVGEFEYAWTATSMAAALHLMQVQPVSVLLLDKGFGLPGVLRILEAARSTPSTHVIVWGSAMAESEALQLLQNGARGILRRTADPGTLVACVRSISIGARWLEDCVFRDSTVLDRPRRSRLTGREEQVLQLVRAGLKNREIGGHLGIQPGTVKIHLKHIFEKTGASGRHSLMLDLLRSQELEQPAARAAVTASR